MTWCITLNQKLNPVTARINGGTLTLEAFPRKRGYEVVGVLQKAGKEPVFASHGTFPSKASALEGMREVLGAFKRNPSWYYPKTTKKLENVFAENLVLGLSIPLDGIKPTSAQLRRWKIYKRFGDPFNIPQKDRIALLKKGLIA